MKKRGRASAASQEIQPPTAIEIVPRQQPPVFLPKDERAVWVVVVDTHPAEWFTPATAPVLAQYCRHVVSARRISELLAAALEDPELSIKNYDRLLKMQERESRAIAALATKMRLTQQATTNHRGNKQQPANRKPWEG